MEENIKKDEIEDAVVVEDAPVPEAPVADDSAPVFSDSEILAARRRQIMEELVKYQKMHRRNVDYAYNHHKMWGESAKCRAMVRKNKMKGLTKRAKKK